MTDLEAGLDLDLAARDQGSEGLAQGAARGELVVGAAAEGFLRRSTAQQPDHLGGWRLVLQPREIDQRADRRMAGAQHGHGLAGVARALAAQHVGHAVGDAPLQRLLADRRQAIGAGRVGRQPGAAGVDHRVGLELFGALAVLVANREGLEGAAIALHLVEAGAADRRDPAVEPDAVAEPGPARQRLEILRHQFAAVRIVAGIGRVPADFLEKPLGRLVDVVLPGREHADVAPLAHGMRGLGAGLEHHRLHAAFQHVRGGGETDRAGAQDGDGLRLGRGLADGVGHRLLLSFQNHRNIRAKNFQATLGRRTGAQPVPSAQHSSTMYSSRPRIRS
jgi:hypothetical protein